jgi:hypothetical protein
LELNPVAANSDISTLSHAEAIRAAEASGAHARVVVENQLEEMMSQLAAEAAAAAAAVQSHEVLAAELHEMRVVVEHERAAAAAAFQVSAHGAHH